jgi:hypothetical protein
LFFLPDHPLGFTAVTIVPPLYLVVTPIRQCCNCTSWSPFSNNTANVRIRSHLIPTTYHSRLCADVSSNSIKSMFH